jgi:carbonic anhydrase
MFSASASASTSISASATATATGNTLEEAINNANNSAVLSAEIALRKPLPNNPQDHTAKTLVLHCIDFRLVSYEDFFLNSTGYLNDFDEFTLAGASLGYNGIPNYYPTWQNCCDDHIQLSYDLHDIYEVTIIDHLSCGAYKLVYTPEQLAGDGEYNLHIENLNKAEITIKEKFPFITKVNKFIMDLNGSVTKID